MTSPQKLQSAILYSLSYTTQIYEWCRGLVSRYVHTESATHLTLFLPADWIHIVTYKKSSVNIFDKIIHSPIVSPEEHKNSSGLACCVVKREFLLWVASMNILLLLQQNLCLNNHQSDYLPKRKIEHRRPWKDKRYSIRKRLPS